MSNIIKERRSIRKYTDELVSKEKIDEIIETARFAPSWANTQIARYHIIYNKDIINNIGNLGVKGFTYNTKTISNCNSLVVLTYVKGLSGVINNKVDSKANWEVFDAGIACESFCLSAHMNGVGTCIMGVIDKDKIVDLIDLDENEEVGAVITCGYAKEEGKPTPRFEVEEIRSFID